MLLCCWLSQRHLQITIENKMDLEGDFQVFVVIQNNPLILQTRKPQPSLPEGIVTLAMVSSIRFAKSGHINGPLKKKGRPSQRHENSQDTSSYPDSKLDHLSSCDFNSLMVSPCEMKPKPSPLKGRLFLSKMPYIVGLSHL